MNENEPQARAGKTDDIAALMRTDDHGAPKFLDPATTMDIVQRYVESERNRTRRILLMTTAVFLFAALLLLVIFLLVGIYVIRNSRVAAERADLALDQSTVYATQVVDISNKISSVEETGKQIKGIIEKEQAGIVQRNKALKSDLQRFGQWVESTSSKELTALATLEERLGRIEQTISAKEKELAQVKERYVVAKAATGIPSVTNSLPSVAAQVVVADSAVAEMSSTSGTGGDTEENTSQGIETAPLAAVAEASTATKGNEEGIPEEITVPERPEMPRHVSEVSFHDGDKYKGEFKDGLFNGWGIYTSKNGDKYEGEFKNNMKHGRGAFVTALGEKYVGDYKHDMKAGKGAMFFVNGDRYVGEFKDDMMDGKGAMIYQNGNKYAGDFKTGLKCGNGVFTFANKDVYQGEFKDDVREGKGTYLFSDGSKYIGDFKDGQRHGIGRYAYPEGDEYYGEFRNGRKHGRGVCTYANGARVNVRWEDDKLVEETPL